MTFQQLLENAGYDTRGYSGRFMYGKQCLAVDTDDSPFEFAANIMESVLDNYNIDNYDKYISLLRNTRSDSMGLGSVYYWPSEIYVKDESEDEEDDSAN